MDLLTVEEAASRLGVQASTIYAYVSRGTLARAPQSQRRQTVFLRSDVEALAERSRRTARTTAATTPRASDISSIVHDTLYYRGREATELAAASSFEAVADFLWDARSRPDDATHAVWAEAASRLPGTEFLSELPASHLPADRFKVTVALAGAADPLRYDFAPTSVRTVGRSLLSALARSLPVPPGHEREAMGESLVDVFWARLSPVESDPRHTRLLGNAMVVLADHGPAPSTSAVRAAAAVGADPYSALLTGMGTASGLLHGGSSLAAQTLFTEIRSVSQVPTVMGNYLRSSPRIPGFGQPRYHGPDPRARFILERLTEEAYDPERLEIVHAVLQTMRERRDAHPNIEFALGALCYVYDMTYGAGEAVFVLARCAGWIAHAIEEYEKLVSQGRIAGMG